MCVSGGGGPHIHSACAWGKRIDLHVSVVYKYKIQLISYRLIKLSYLYFQYQHTYSRKICRVDGMPLIKILLCACMCTITPNINLPLLLNMSFGGKLPIFPAIQ